GQGRAVQGDAALGFGLRRDRGGAEGDRAGIAEAIGIENGSERTAGYGQFRKGGHRGADDVDNRAIQGDQAVVIGNPEYRRDVPADRGGLIGGFAVRGGGEGASRQAPFLLRDLPDTVLGLARQGQGGVGGRREIGARIGDGSIEDHLHREDNLK